MNLNQAEAIATLYEELIKSIDKTKLKIPNKYFRGKFTVDDIKEMSLEEGSLKVEWSQYVGCGDYDTETTYESLHNLFED